MSERAIIADRIKKKQAEVQSLERKLESARVYLQALEDVMREIEKVGGDAGAETALRSGSSVARAREIILEAGEPVHIDHLLERLGKEVTRETKASLTGSLAAYVRRDEIFTRPAPNTFGLIELSHDKPLPAHVAEEPPATFGSVADDDEIPF